jgi:hypothetical protein
MVCAVSAFSTSAACDDCGAIHVITGDVPPGPQPAVLIVFGCHICVVGMGRAIIPGGVQMKVKVKPEEPAA